MGYINCITRAAVEVVELFYILNDTLEHKTALNEQSLTRAICVEIRTCIDTF